MYLVCVPFLFSDCSTVQAFFQGKKNGVKVLLCILCTIYMVSRSVKYLNVIKAVLCVQCCDTYVLDVESVLVSHF